MKETKSSAEEAYHRASREWASLKLFIVIVSLSRWISHNFPPASPCLGLVSGPEPLVPNLAKAFTDLTGIPENVDMILQYLPRFVSLACSTHKKKPLLSWESALQVLENSRRVLWEEALRVLEAKQLNDTSYVVLDTEAVPCTRILQHSQAA